MSTAEESRALALMASMKVALAQETNLDNLIRLQGQAEAVRCLVKKAKLGLDMHNEAAAFKLRAERRAGEMLGALNLRGGSRSAKSHDGTLRLQDLGITRNQSARWQREAAVPEAEFEAYLEEAQAEGKEVTAAELLRRACRRAIRGSKPRRRSGRFVATTLSEAGPDAHVELLAELLGEIKEHQRVLGKILLPFCELNQAPTVAERRHAARLLRESQPLIATAARLSTERFHGVTGD
jgi:hypothetical protein